MRFVDNLHRKPSDAFTTAAIFACFGLNWIFDVVGDYLDGRGGRFSPAFGAVLFLTGAAVLYLRGFQMQREKNLK